MSPLEIVQMQFDLYNNRNLEQFCNLFSKEIIFKNFETQNIILKGLDELKIHMIKRFSNPRLKATLLSRMQLNDVIVDHEKVTGLQDSDLEAIAIYKIKDSKIAEVTFIGLA